MSDAQNTLTLNGNPITLEQLEAYKRKLQENTSSPEKIVEVAPGQYKTKTQLHG